MRTTILISLALFTQVIAAQITLDKEVILQGGQQVTGLETPVLQNQALSAESVQAAGYMFANAVGTNTLTALLLPAPDSLVAGLNVHVEVVNTNTGAVTLQLNTFSAAPVLKNGVQQLDSADVLSGMIIQLVFDGNAFQLINGRERQRRPCPTGFVEINSQYCIEQDERPAIDFPEAAEVCGNLGGKICSWAEFYYACELDTVFGLNNMTGDYEWTNSMANGDDYVRVAGWNNCRSAGTNATISATPRTYRCCYRR